MNRIVTSIITKKASNAAENAVESAKEAVESLKKLADEDIIISRRVFSLEIAVALLGGIVLGMLISPRKKVSYKIASNNNINGGDDNDADEDGEYEYDEEEDTDENPGGRNKFIKL